jgi:hypothetical protein
VTPIGPEGFAWCARTGHQSRIHFLELLQAGRRRSDLTEEALADLREQGLPQEPMRRLHAQPPNGITDPDGWTPYREALEIIVERPRRIAPEGALRGGWIENGFSLDRAIVREGAGPFALLLHAGCGVPAERRIHKRIPLNDRPREEQTRVRGEIWDGYADLKAYRRAPDPRQAPILAARFDAIFTQRTGFETLNQTRKRRQGHQDDRLRVLKRPDIPRHTHGSENDIRGYVKGRKVRGGTRSDLGRRGRDTFARLKKTCRKLGISFWAYLTDRIEQRGEIAPLPDIIRQRAAAMP